MHAEASGPGSADRAAVPITASRPELVEASKSAEAYAAYATAIRSGAPPAPGDGAAGGAGA